jgi:hypothetical protein
MQVIVFTGSKLNMAMSEKLPTGRPRWSDPREWAASWTMRRPVRAARSATRSWSQRRQS